MEGASTVAVESIEAAVNEAIDRAVGQFKDLAPPVVDRSTTAALTRLEERIAALTLQRDHHDRETKTTLEVLEETVGRLASAHAEDLEQILDTIEATATPAVTAEPADEERLARIEEAIDTLVGLPKTTEELTDSVAEQFVAFNAQMEAVRRRMSVRARATVTLDDTTLASLADLVATRLAHANPAGRTQAAGPAKPVPPTRKARQPNKATAGRNRRPVD